MENKSGLGVAVHRLKRPLGGGGFWGVALDISLSGRKERVSPTATGALPALAHWGAAGWYWAGGQEYGNPT